MTFTELKELYELFDNNRTKVKNAIYSIEREYISFDEIISYEYIYCDSIFYSTEEFVEAAGYGVIDISLAFYCEGNEEWYHIDDTSVVYEGDSQTRYSNEYIEQNDYTRFRGDWYDDYALERHDIVWVEDVGEYRYSDEVWWCEESECYYSYNKQRFIREYHDGSYRTLIFNDKSKYRIGYEIEKEDETVRNSICIDEFEEYTDWKWRKEKDGSLDSESGYELISPTFEFDVDKIFEHIESNEQLVAHINAEHSYSCGGHIHLSEKDLNGSEIFEKVKGYTPLFYALYYGRVNKSYCKGKSNKDLENENEKYQAIKIHHDRVEFRIISAVPNVETLKWRTKLLMMILQNPTDDIIKAYYNVDTKFTKLLKQVYSDEKLAEVKERFIKFTREFEQLEIKNNN